MGSLNLTHAYLQGFSISIIEFKTKHQLMTNFGMASADGRLNNLEVTLKSLFSCFIIS